MNNSLQFDLLCGSGGVTVTGEDGGVTVDDGVCA